MTPFGKQWKHPGSPSLKKFKRIHSAGKVMVSIFWDSQGVIMIDYLEQDRTINSAGYAGKLMVTPGNCKKDARQTDLRYSALEGQRHCPQVTTCHDRCI